jgi:hypothetical protein
MSYYTHYDLTAKTMTLPEIVKEKAKVREEQDRLKVDFEKKMNLLKNSEKQFERLEQIALKDINIHYVQIAESILRVQGDISALVDGRRINEAAALDIANDCSHMRREYFGNKRYEGYYQGSDHPYGYGPKHGGIVDMVGLKDPARRLSEEEQTACIYYLMAYNRIYDLLNQPLQQ